MDEAAEPEVLREIKKTHDSFDQQSIRFDHVMTRRSGQRRFVDLHMHMPANWTLGRAAEIRSNVEQVLIGAVPVLRATIQLLPSDDDPKEMYIPFSGPSPGTTDP